MKTRFLFQIILIVCSIFLERYVIAIPLTWLLLSWYFHTKRLSLVWTVSLCILSDMFLQLPFGSSGCIVAVVDVLLPFASGSRLTSLIWRGTIGIGLGIASAVFHSAFSVPHIFVAGVLCCIVYTIGSSAVYVEEIGNASL